MKYNEKKRKPPKKKTEAEIIVKLDKKANDTKDVEYKYRSGIETFVQVPGRMWNRYSRKKPVKPLHYFKISAMSSRRRDWTSYGLKCLYFCSITYSLMCEEGLTLMFVFIFDYLYLLEIS